MDTLNFEKKQIAEAVTRSANLSFDDAALDKVFESAVADGTALNVRGQLIEFLENTGWKSTDLLSSQGAFLHKDSAAGKMADKRYQSMYAVALKGHITADVQIDADSEKMKGAKRTEYITSEVQTWLDRYEALQSGAAIGANHKTMIAGWKTNAKDSVSNIRISLKNKEDIAAGKTKAKSDIDDTVGKLLDRLTNRVEKFDNLYKSDAVMAWVRSGRVLIQEGHLWDDVDDVSDDADLGDDLESSEQ